MAIDIATEPRITTLAPVTMAVVRTTGAPAAVAQLAISALYAAASAAGGARGALRARWPDAHLVPQERWTGVWALPIADGVQSLPQIVPGMHVEVETWDYGQVAEIVHVGPYAAEDVGVARLREHVQARGYELSGPHEEEYLTPPGAAEQRTVIRFPVVPAAA
jgi:hypothetical protein